MTTLFVSDLHLDVSRPHIIDLFADFVAREAVHADALYILGDLFDAWIGDDAEDATGKRFIEAMRPLRAARKPCFYLHGNRDFLLGERFAHAAGMTLLPDPSLIDLHGTPTLLMHGDSLCIDDEAYQAFRTLSRTPTWQRAFLSRSIAEREAFAQQARAESRRYTTDAINALLMDVNDRSVGAILAQFDAARLIHGHTHRPAIHRIGVDRQAVERIVLGDWYVQRSVLLVDECALSLSSGTPG